MTNPVHPDHPSASAYPGPEDIERVVFDNGLTVLVRENHAAPLTVLDGYVPAGAIHDPADRAGLSAFTASMLTRGSVDYDFDRFNETIESVGASLGMASDTHITSFGLTCLSEDFARLTAVLADALRRPTFPAEQMERLRRQKLVGLQEREQDTSRMANLRYHEAIYGADHPYGRAISGYPKSVDAITRTELIDFHARRYTPNGAIIVVSGDVETERVLALLERTFGDWRGPVAEQDVAPVNFPAATTRIDVPIPGKFQADVVLGAPAVPRHHPDYDAVRVANTVLGVFGLMGRLGEVVREEQGLAYYAYSIQEAEPAAGVWTGIAGVNPANVDQAIASILHEFERLGAEPVPEEELADSQAYLTGVLPLALETNAGVASTLLNMEWYGLGLDYLQRYRSLIESVTPADVQRVAQEYLGRDNKVIVVAGGEGTVTAKY